MQYSVLSALSGTQGTIDDNNYKSKINTAQHRLDLLLKTYIAQAPHLPSHAKATRLSAHNLSSEPNKHTNSVAHRKFLTRAERPHHSDIDALERRCIRHARTPGAPRARGIQAAVVAGAPVKSTTRTTQMWT